MTPSIREALDRLALEVQSDKGQRDLALVEEALILEARWLRRGGRLTTLSEQLGHSSIATTYDLYGHLDATDVRRDLALMETR